MFKRLMVLFCLEDITAGVHRQRDQETPGGISPMADFITLGRQLNLGAIAVVHGISEISDIMRQNVQTFFICGLQGENPFIIRDTLHLSLEEQQAFSRSTTGEILCVNPLLFARPVYATFEQIQIPGTCDEAMRQIDLIPFRKQIKTTPPRPISIFLPELTSKNSPEKTVHKITLEQLPPGGFEFMAHIAIHLTTSMMNQYQQMGLNPTQGRRITKRLEELTLIQLHTFSTGKRGGRITLVEITAAGWQLMEGQGFRQPVTRTQGGWEHEIGALLLEVEGKKLGYGVSFEVDLGGVRFDVEWLERKTGKKYYFNIGISHPDHEVESMDKFLRLPVSQNHTFTLVARDVDFAKKVQEILKQKDPHRHLAAQIEIKLLADFIPV